MDTEVANLLFTPYWSFYLIWTGLMFARNEPPLPWFAGFLASCFCLVAGAKCSVAYRDVAAAIGFVSIHGVSSLYELASTGRLNVFRQLMFAGLAAALIFSPEIAGKYCG